MATNYPGSLDSYSTKNSGDTISEAHVNDLQDATEELQIKLGTSQTGLAATTNTALLGRGASATGFAVISLANSSLVTGTLTAERGGTGVTNTNTAGGAVVLAATSELPTSSGTNVTGLWRSSGTQVYTLSQSPTAFTDLSLSSVVGSNKALAFLKIKNRAGASANYVSFRTNGETDENWDSGNVGSEDTKYILAGDFASTLVETDGDGVVEWRGAALLNTDIWVLGYVV
jgi:hypothetical protein